MKSNIWTFVIVAVAVGILSSLITLGITGNVVKINQDRLGKYKVYTTAEVDALINNIGGYMDPTECGVRVSTKPNTDQTMSTICELDEFVGAVTHIDCPLLNDIRVIISTGWNGNSLPTQLSYTCMGADSSATWKAPSQIYAYCCKFKSTSSTSTKEEQTKHVSIQDKSTKKISMS